MRMIEKYSFHVDRQNDWRLPQESDRTHEASQLSLTFYLCVQHTRCIVLHQLTVARSPSFYSTDHPTLPDRTLIHHGLESLRRILPCTLLPKDRLYIMLLEQVNQLSHHRSTASERLSHYTKSAQRITLNH